VVTIGSRLRRDVAEKIHVQVASASSFRKVLQENGMKMKISTAVILLVGMVVMVSLCGSAKTKTPKKVLMTGQWGGSDIQLNVTENEVHLSFECREASFSGPITLSDNGEFQVKAAIVAEGAGPSSAVEDSSNDVQLRGKVDGDHLRLEVLAPGSQKPRVYHLGYGQKSHLKGCR
jgi:hypothetical protein